MWGGGEGYVQGDEGERTPPQGELDLGNKEMGILWPFPQTAHGPSRYWTPSMQPCSSLSKRPRTESGAKGVSPMGSRDVHLPSHRAGSNSEHLRGLLVSC